MSKSSTSSKIPPQLPSKSAWAKGPPQSSRSESPAPTHSRRPSAAIGQAVPIKDGVSIPRNNVGSVKNVTFGSIDDASAPISSSPAATPAVKPVDAVKSFGSVPNEVNGTTKPKLQKADIKKLFQTPTSTGGHSTPSESSSPAPRPASLPPQTPTPPASSFTPQNGARSQQPSSGAPPRSPQYSRQLPNGNNSRNGPPSGLSSPRLAPMTHTGQPAGMSPQPPPQMTAMPPPTMWPPYYYIDPNYLQYQQSWAYGMPQPMPQQQPPQQQPHIPHPGMPVSPRNPPPPLQGPGTPTPAHAVPAVHSPHPNNLPHTSPNISGLSSPPPTPSTSTSGVRLNQNAQAFVPTRPTSKIILKSADGIEVNIAELKSKSAATTPVATVASSSATASPKRKSVIRIETPEDKAKRVAEEKEAARLKAESDEKSKKAKEEQERKTREEQERKDKEAAEKKKQEEEERLRKEQAEKERERKIEEELKERLRKEEETRKQKEAEEAAAAEKERLRKEEEEKGRQRKAEEEKERQRKEEEEKKRQRKEEEEKERQIKEEEERKRKVEDERAQKEKAEQSERKDKIAVPAVPAKPDESLEEGEVVDDASSVPAKEQDKKDKATLRINTTPASPSANDIPRRRPGPLDLSTAKGPVAPPLPSALATARIIEDIKTVPYPEGIKSPRVELNANAKDGKFRYDREFLLQFMAICKDKPDSLPPLDAIGLEPSDFPVNRGGSQRGNARDRTPSTSHPPIPFPGKGNVFPPIGKFVPMPGSGRSQDPSRSVSVTGVAAPFGRPAQMQRTTSQGASSGRVRSQRGGKRDPNKQAGQGSSFQPGPANAPALDYVPLQATANRWDRKTLISDTETPEFVDRKVKSLLNKLTMEKFDSISDQIVTWANKSEKEKDGRTLIQVIRLVFEKATDEATWSEMYARLCRKMMETVSSKVQDDGIKNNEGKPIAGGQLFRKYLLNRCQEDFERGWAAKEATAAAAASKGKEDAKVAEKEGTEEAELYSEEYYAAQKAKRQGLGLIKFIGELFKLQMLTERIMHECIKKLLGNVENPEEEEIESLCKLLTTVGSILDTNKARAHMDVYFSRMKELTKSPNVSSRMQFMLQDVIELRERKWISRNAVAAPTTIAAVHEQAARDSQANTYQQRTISMSRGGSKRGADRGDYQQAGPDGWTTAGPSSTPRPPPKAGDLSKFGQITKSSTPATFGPASVFSNKNKESKKEITRSSSSSNMFSMLSSNSEAAAEPTGKSSRPPSRKTSVDFTQTGGVPPDGPPQRKRLLLQPRTKPLEEHGPPAASPEVDSSEDEEDEEEPVMTDEQAKKKIEEDTKEFFAVRSIEEAEVYFTKLPTVHHHKLVDKLVSLALESKEADAQLVSDFFDVASSKELCSMDAFEAGFVGPVEFLDDVAIDAPKAPSFMVIMIKGPPFDDEQLARLAAKSEQNGPSLLSS